MKKYLLFFALLAGFGTLRSQVAIENDSTYTTVPSGSVDVAAHNTIDNNSNQQKTFQWVRTVISAPAEWTSGVCDKNLCYFETVSTKQFVMEAQETGATLDLHLYPNNYYAGLGVFELTVSEVADPANSASAIYVFDTGISGTKEIQLANFKAYPNPTAGLFTLSGTEGKIAYLAIHDLSGKQVQRFSVAEGDWYDIANLPTGTYMMNLLDENQQPLSNARLISKF
ncbi:MAG: T9SS type A sorting domain-containing protein [Lewinellaceae bacterium]|nr:T9SS type A sorting domain-containing protein [Saprospiraceae bacterium]MCB9336932.1 T9SS type A sorting domain-containing protein [Lewinellaceae bacterium]